MPDAIRRLTLGCPLAGFAGQEVPAWLAEAPVDGLGGVVLFGSNIGDATGLDRLTGELGARAGRDVVIAPDEEGRDGPRLDALDPCNPVIGVRSVGASPQVAALPAPHRPLVVEVRDPHRDPGQRAALDAAVRHPDSVIVDAGRPAEDLPPLALVRTRGVAPGRSAAGSDRLVAGVPA